MDGPRNKKKLYAFDNYRMTIYGQKNISNIIVVLKIKTSAAVTFSSRYIGLINKKKIVFLV